MPIPNSLPFDTLQGIRNNAACTNRGSVFALGFSAQHRACSLLFYQLRLHASADVLLTSSIASSFHQLLFHMEMATEEVQDSSQSESELTLAFGMIRQDIRQIVDKIKKIERDIQRLRRLLQQTARQIALEERQRQLADEQRDQQYNHRDQQLRTFMMSIQSAVQNFLQHQSAANP